MSEGLQLERLEALMAERGLGPSELARLSGVSRNYIWKICTGRAPNVSAVEVQRLAGALRTTVDYLLGLSDEKLPDNANAMKRLSEDVLDGAMRLNELPEPLRTPLLSLITALSDMINDDDRQVRMENTRQLLAIYRLLTPDDQAKVQAIVHAEWVEYRRGKRDAA